MIPGETFWSEAFKQVLTGACGFLVGVALYVMYLMIVRFRHGVDSFRGLILAQLGIILTTGVIVYVLVPAPFIPLNKWDVWVYFTGIFLMIAGLIDFARHDLQQTKKDNGKSGEK